MPRSNSACASRPARIELPVMIGTIAAPIELPTSAATSAWSTEAEQELHKIPFFVRGKARRNTERFAQERNLALITLETLYDAKAHFGR